MTVEELIEKLKACRPQAQVEIVIDSGGDEDLWTTVSQVEEVPDLYPKPKVILS